MAYKMYVENPEVGQAANAVLIGLLMLIAFNGIIGWLIGKSKGRGKAGFWFGILLGWIGWIVAAFLQPSVAHEAKRARAIRDAVK